MKKKKLRPLKKLRKDLWGLFSKFRRKEGADKNGLVRCCTCGTLKHWKNMHAGHFIHGHLDYNSKNIHAQCPRCNKWLHGALAEYARYLIHRYGAGVIDELHRAVLDESKWTRDQIEALIKLYKEKV